MTYEVAPFYFPFTLVPMTSEISVTVMKADDFFIGIPQSQPASSDSALRWRVSRFATAFRASTPSYSAW